MNDITKLLWLAVLIGFFAGLAVMLMRVDRSDEWKRAHIAQLVINRYGELDIAAVAFWGGIGVSALSVIYSLFRPVGESFVAVYSVFTTQITVPLMLKLIFKAKAPDLPSVTKGQP